jgi:hypothetical protein
MTTLEINKIDLSSKASGKKGESNLLLIFQRKYREDTPSDAVCFNNGNKTHVANGWWRTRIKLPNGTKSKYITKSLKTKDKDEAIEKAIKLYRELTGNHRNNQIVKDEIKSRNIIDKIRPLGVCEITGIPSKNGNIVRCNPEVVNLMNKHANLNASFLYAIFPSMERPTIIDSSPLDSLILNGSLERGKIGISGTNNKGSTKNHLSRYYSPSMIQLKNRLEKYKLAASCKDWADVKDLEFEWMEGLCAPNEKWYVAIFHLLMQTDLDRMMRYSEIHAVEQIMIAAWATRHHKFPIGNYGERPDSYNNPNRRPKPSGSGNPKSNKPSLNGPIPEEQSDDIKKGMRSGYTRKDVGDFDHERGYRWVHDS